MNKKNLKKTTALLIVLLLTVALTSCTLFDGSSTINSKKEQIPTGVIKASETATAHWKETVISNTIGASTMIEATFYNGSRGAGSGFIVSEDGYVVTNAHVIRSNRYSQKASNIKVKILNANYHQPNQPRYITYSASEVFADIRYDIAILKIYSSEKFQYINFGDSNSMKYGSPSLIIGNPEGIGISVANAIVANPYYVMTYETSFFDKISIPYIQVDANVNHGNSGGPLINRDGNVVGIVSLKREGDGSSSKIIEGIGFAITSRQAVEIINNKTTLNLKLKK